MDEYKIYRKFLCIDLKSFYASVECVERKLDPFKTPLVVADKSRSNGSVVLAVTPYLKKIGVKSRCRVFELPKDKSIIFAKPKMKKYLEVSTKIISIYLDYVSEEDIHIYSIDEVFLDVTEYLSYYQMNDYELARTILDDVYKQTNIPATCGIGPNMLLCKVALDFESKKVPSGIAKWDYKDVKTKLWGIKPLSKMWGIGVNMERNLNNLGIFSIYDLANYDVKKLKKRYGIIGEELYYHAHGIDMSRVQDKIGYKPKSKSYGIGQTLFSDYYAPDIFQIILEMVDEVTRRLRLSNKKCFTVHLEIGFSRNVVGGFSRQIKLEFPTFNEMDIYKTCLQIFNRYYEDEPIRKVRVSVSSLVEEESYQLSLFEDVNKKIKDHKLSSTIDNIKYRFGRNSVLRTSSNFKHSPIKSRNKMIGGHNA